MDLPGMAAVMRPLKHLRVRAGCLSGLEFLWLEITRRCNLLCVHCYADSGPQLPLSERMTLADWCRVMDEARAAGCRRLQFIGGEPTLHPQLPELLEHATRAGFGTIEVFTNATLLKAPLLRLIKRLGVHVHFSFYSHEAAVHDAICGQPGSHARTVQGVEHLVRHGVHLTAGIIVVPQNEGHEAEATALLRRLGVGRIGVDRVRGVGRGARLAAGTTPATELCGQCWKGKLSVDPSGDAHPCVFSRDTTVGNVFATPVDAIVAGARLQAFRRDTFLGTQGG